jgi:hypothetical protein
VPIILNEIHFFHLILFIRTPNLLEIGSNYYFNTTIEVKPVRTLVNGMCYRFKMPNTLPRYQGTLTLVMSSSTSGIDKLENLLFYIASDNTWQGVIINDWPYSNTPLLVKGVFSVETTSIISVDFDENIWKYREGSSDFDVCMNDQPTKECISIFDPRPNRCISKLNS